MDDVLFTHAHIDHTGYFPRLAADGFTGRALATPPTKALLGVLLPDSGGLQEEEARFANKKGFSRHQPAKALYTEDDANRSLQLLQRMEFDQETPLHKGLKVRLHRAGHILGAAFAEIRYRDPDADWKTVVFSGDLGRRAVPILQDPAPLPACDVLVCESTYGDRLHEATDPKEQLRRELAEAFRRGGFTVIPAFAVGRTQEILYHLFELFEEGRLPKVPVYVDSPMANSVVELYCRYRSEHDVEMQELEDNVGSPLQTPYFTVVRKRDESKKLNDLAGPGIVISASGMATGGRVLHHLLHRLPRRAEHRPLRRLPGRGVARAAAPGRGDRRDGPRRGAHREGGDPADPGPLGPRRRQRDHRVDQVRADAAEARLPDPRRAGRAGRLRRPPPARSSAWTSTSPSPTTSWRSDLGRGYRGLPRPRPRAEGDRAGHRARVGRPAPEREVVPRRRAAWGSPPASPTPRSSRSSRSSSRSPS